MNIAQQYWTHKIGSIEKQFGQTSPLCHGNKDVIVELLDKCVTLNWL